MLDLAMKYKTLLEEGLISTFFQEKYKYYYNTSYCKKIEIEDSTWNRHEFVSICNNKIIGKISYSIDRDTGNVYGLSIINFTDNHLAFGKDLKKCLTDIFEVFNFNKISFSVVVGNPIEKSYDRLCKDFGGSIIGIKKKHDKLYDGQYYDRKLYEVLREDYLMARATRRDRNEKNSSY